MSGRCGNPYCDATEPEMRLPTKEELLLWETDADEEARNLLNKGQVALNICKACGLWTAERWDEKEQKTVRGWVPFPFRFKLGQRVKVILQGRRFGIQGTVQRRALLAKAIMPPPVPENYYWLLFEPGEREEGFREDHLEPGYPLR